MWVEKYKIRGEHGVYTVSIDDKGMWGCSCPVWKFKRRQCKHIDALET